MTDCFSPTFLKVFCPNIKSPKKRENSNCLVIPFGLISFLSSQVFLSGIEIGVNIDCTLFFTGNHDWSIT